MYNDNQSRGRKETILSRYRSVLGPGRAPSGLGLLFLLSMVHELARADSGELSAQQLAELSSRLVVQRGELLAVVDVIRNSYPEISDQLFGEQAFEVTGGRGSEIDLLVLAEEITALEESGYLDREEILRLHKALKALQEGDWSGDDVVAQAGPSEATDRDAARGEQTRSADGKTEGKGAGEGGAAGAEEVAVDIEALPPTGAGPLAALGPVLVGGSTIVAADIIATPRVSAPDTTTPAYVSTSTSIANQTITLTYSEALSTTGPPLASSFSVQTRATATDPWGASVAIDSVSVSGSTVTLDLNGTPLQTGQLLRITYTDPAGDAANAIQDAAGNDAATVVVSMGIVADGYVRGAQIYIDANSDGVAQASERLEGVTTDANGNFFLPDSVGSGAILAVGGVNIDTGVANTIVLKAPAGSIMISPLTTLVQSYIEQNGGTAANANAAVASALGITLPTGQTLTTYDPLATLQNNGTDATALAVQKAAAQVATVVQAAAAQPSGGVSAATVANNVITNLVNQIETAVTNSTTVNLTDTATITTALNSVGTTVTVTEVEGATDGIATATNLSGISAAQAALLDTTAPVAPTGLAVAASSDTGTSNTDGDTRDTTPTIRVTLNVTATDGTAAVAGNTVRIYEGATQLGSATLTSPHIANGYVDITVSTLSVGEHNLKATVTDNADPVNVSADSALYNVTIESGAPAAPTFSLTVDSGVSGTDGITNNGAVSVSGLEPGASFQYSTDGGSHWITGSGSSFTLPGSAFYEAGTIQVRQTDVAGITGAVASSSSNITVGVGTPLTIASATESSMLGALLAQGNQDGYLHVLDLADNSIDITAAQAKLLIDQGLQFAADDTVNVQANGTLLNTSLTGLQQLGVDTIAITGVSGDYAIAAGTGTLDFGALPTISAGSGVNVGLELADNLLNAPTTATQAGQLLAAGIDVLMAADGSLSVGSTQLEVIRNGGLSFDTADSITMQIASGDSNEGVAINNLVSSFSASGAAGYDNDLDKLDALDNAITITDAQASALVGESLAFAADDTVTVNATVGAAAGTQLQTSLHGLQQLGVDMVGITGATSGVVDIQAGGTVDFGSLPQVSTPSGVLAGLELSDSALSGLSGSEMTALVNRGFDVLSASDNSLTLTSAQVDAIHAAGLQLNPADSVTMQIASGDSNEATVIGSLVSAIGTPAGYDRDLDVLDVVDNGIGISDAQASALVGAGLQFAAGDTGVAVQATGTHLSTSLTDLQRLGVDFVHTDSGINTMVLDWGTSGGVTNTLPVFDSADQTKVLVRDSDLDDVLSFLNAGGHNTPNIDVLSVALRDAFGAELAGPGVGDPLFQVNNMGIELNASVNQLVTLGMILEAADGSNDSLAALYGLSGQSLATGLTAAGIGNIHIDAITQFQVTDGDLNALLNAGLVSANAAADVTVTNNTDGTLDVTLAQLANIGADQVQTSGATLQVNAGVSFSNGAELTVALNELVATFEAQGGGTVQQLFETADTVDLRVDGSLPSFELGAELATKLQLLGIDDIKDADGHSIKPNP